MAYRSWRQWRKRGGSYINKTMTSAEKTWFSSIGSKASRRQRDGSFSDGSGANLDLWQRLRQDSSNGFDNMVAEQTCLGISVRNSNDSGKTAATVEAQTWLTGPCISGVREAADTTRQEQRQQNKLGLADTAGLQQGDSKATARWQ